MSSKGSPKSDKVIPIRRVPLSDQSQLPADYSATPGGTLFSTTPGGTRIIYDRDFLLQCRNSPLTKAAPPNLPSIPGVTHPSNHITQRENVVASDGDQPAVVKNAAEERGGQVVRCVDDAEFVFSSDFNAEDTIRVYESSDYLKGNLCVLHADYVTDCLSRVKAAKTSDGGGIARLVSLGSYIMLPASVYKAMQDKMPCKPSDNSKGLDCTSSKTRIQHVAVPQQRHETFDSFVRIEHLEKVDKSFVRIINLDDPNIEIVRYI